MGNVITEIFNTISTQVLYPLYYGLIAVVGIVALILLITELIRAAGSPDGNRRSDRLKAAGIILGICIVAGFAPFIINWVIGLSGGGIGGVNV